MSTDSNGARRKRYFVDPKLQLSLALPLVGMLALVGVAYVAALYLLPGEIAIRSMTAEETRSMFLRANVLYFVIAAAGLGLVAVFLTHRIAGPVYVVEGALRAMTRGELDRRLALRPNDALQSLAASARDLRDHLRHADDERQRLIKEASTRLEANDTASVRDLLTQLADLGCAVASEANEGTAT
jgi:methyl-accepting chemotaxis protein